MLLLETKVALNMLECVPSHLLIESVTEEAKRIYRIRVKRSNGRIYHYASSNSLNRLAELLNIPQKYFRKKNEWIVSTPNNSAGVHFIINRGGLTTFKNQPKYKKEASC